MLITKKYTDIISGQPKLSNEVFLAHQLWSIQNIFEHEMIAIKNINCEFIAMTDKLSQEFNLGAEMLGKTFNALPNVAKCVSDEIHRQELELIANRKTQTSFYFYKKDNNILNYLVKKRPLINPSTNEVVGILVASEKILPNVHRKFIIHEFLNIPNFDPVKLHINSLHRQIMFCLLLGINNRKEIATTLSNITGEYFSENQIKNSLRALYKDFDCSSSNQLVNMILAGKIPFNLPENSIPPGNYILTT